MSVLVLILPVLTDIKASLPMGKFAEGIPHVGIIAGTAEGAALCYRTLCLEVETVLGPGSVHPEITLHSMPLHLYLEAIDLDDWGRVAALMSHSASKLAHVGADFIVCPNNTLHAAFDLVESQVPWLHIAEPVVKRIVQQGWRKIGILGTRIVMEGTIYSHELAQRDIDVVLPKPDERARIQHIIRSELIAGHLASESLVFLQKVISEFSKAGAEAVILGCTELPLFLSDNRSALPLLDSTRLLAQTALQYGVQMGKNNAAQQKISPRLAQDSLETVLF